MFIELRYLIIFSKEMINHDRNASLYYSCLKVVQIELNSIVVLIFFIKESTEREKKNEEECFREREGVLHSAIIDLHPFIERSRIVFI